MKKMKVHLFGIAVLITAYSCSSTYKAGNNSTDDVYYSSKNQPPPTPPPPSSDNYNTNDNNYIKNNSGNNQNDNSGQTQQDDYAPGGDNSTYSQSSDGKSNTYITNNYNSDNYDYEYSSRIRRFYNPVYGNNYYDPYYTNSYWYDYNPSSWGVSIYLGYNWWAPSSFYYDPFCYGGFSVGYGYNPYSGYQPYGYGGSYYSCYNHGYNHGYWNGYHDGFYGGNTNPYYYNSYDATSSYYGPRGSISSNSPRFSSQRQGNIAPISTKYEQAISEGRISREPVNVVNKSDIRNNSLTKPSINQERSPVINNQNKNNSIRNNTATKNSIPEINRVNENSTEKNKNIPDRNFGSGRNSNDHINNNTNPAVNPNISRPDINTRDHYRIPQENNQPKNENQRSNFVGPKIYQTPKQEDHHLRREDSRIQLPSRQENRTPVFTPRDEPKQYRQESAPSPQRSQPSRPAEYNNNSGGRRK